MPRIRQLRAWAESLGCATPFVDDRGRPLSVAGYHELRGNQRPTTRILRVLSLAAVAGWLLWSLGVNGRTGFDNAHVFLGAVVTVGVVVLVNGAWVWRRHAKPVCSALSAQLAADGRCGACGYDLSAVLPGSDGCAQCPECGGAWHRDRLFRVVRGQPTRSIDAFVERGHHLPDAASQDDRGVYLARAFRWPPAWLQSTASALTPVSRQKLIAAKAVVVRRFRLWAWSIGSMVWVVVVAAASAGWMFDPDHSALLVAIVPLLIVGVVLYALEGLYLDSAMRRVASEQLGLCLACGDALPKDATPMFDGCIACVRCGHCWHPPHSSSPPLSNTGRE